MATGQLRGQQPATAVTARPSSWRGISNMARGTSRSRVPKLQHHVRSRHSSAAAPSAAAASGRAGGGSGDDGLLAAAGILALLAQQQQSSQQTPPPTGAHLVLADVGFHPAGCEKPLLDGVSMHLPANKLGLLVGRSGSGKTTLLQVLAGLTEQTSGQIYMSRQPLPRGVIDAATRGSGSGSGGAEAPAPSLPPGGTSLSQRMSDVGLVFQFPERHFLGDNIVNELTFTWPRTMVRHHATAVLLLPRTC